VRIDLDEALQRVAVPHAIALLPIQRRAPATARDPVPSHRQPQLGAQVRAIVDERKVFAISDRARRDLMGVEPHAVARRFVVEAVVAVLIGRVAHLEHALVEGEPAKRLRLHRRDRPALRIRGVRRVERQHVLDVGEQQLLVLLFVMQAERDEVFQLALVRLRQQREHAFIDVRAIAFHRFQRRPRDEAALRPRMLLADALVVAVEEHAKAGIEGTEPALVAFEHEGLEEPRDMCEVPLGGARVGHRLHLAVFGRQRGDELQARLADAPIAFGERALRRRGDGR